MDEVHKLLFRPVPSSLGVISWIYTVMEAQPSVKNEANSEKKGISLEGGCPLLLAYDFSFNQTNNPLEK